jgi:hypothetical protein
MDQERSELVIQYVKRLRTNLNVLIEALENGEEGVAMQAMDDLTYNCSFATPRDMGSLILMAVCGAKTVFNTALNIMEWREKNPGKDLSPFEAEAHARWREAMESKGYEFKSVIGDD